MKIHGLNNCLDALKFDENRIGGQMNNILPHGFTFEISQNFRYNPNYKPNDNDAIRIGTEAWGNALMQFVWYCMQDYNAKEVTYESL